MTAVSVSSVSKKYNIYDRPTDRLVELISPKIQRHREFWALRDVSATFEHGTTTALLGPNGSGKSTLLQIIAGIIQPTRGNVQIAGRLTAILELGAGFQPDHTGRENVILNGMILGIGRAEMESKLEEIAQFAGIGDFFDQPVKTYSSGMVVRLAFAAAVTVDPDILLVDEALAVGDAKFQYKCSRKIMSLQEAGKTIIFVSHDVHAVRMYCNNAILLNGGSIVDAGETERVVTKFIELMDSDQVAEKKFVQPAAVS